MRLHYYANNMVLSILLTLISSTKLAAHWIEYLVSYCVYMFNMFRVTYVRNTLKFYLCRVIDHDILYSCKSRFFLLISQKLMAKNINQTTVCWCKIYINMIQQINYNVTIINCVLSFHDINIAYLIRSLFC